VSEDPNVRKRAAIAEVFPKTPFIGGLGLVFEKYEPDDVVMRLPFREDLTNDGTVYHGGVVAAVIDTTAAA
jgi:acyl-coenzyme A thioesterase PaaI-like protein